MSELILVIEDDQDLRRLLRAGLEEEGFEVVAASTGGQAIEIIEKQSPTLMIVDIGLPDTDGRDLVQALRSGGATAPVLFLTALDGMADKLLGFGAGADDYMSKPFNFEELVARLLALSRRSGTPARTTVDDLKLNPLGHSIDVGAHSIKLTPTEFRLLGVLVAKSGEAVRRRMMVAAAWPPGSVVHDNTVDVYVARLRRKLRESGSRVEIHTVHRIGYELR